MHAPHAPQRDERSLGELFGELAGETATLVQQEVALAKTEMAHKASEVGRDVAFLAVGGAVAYAGFLALLAAIVAGLAAAGLQVWLAALLVAVVVALAGYLLVQRGLAALRQTGLAPKRTIQTLKEDVQWAKEKVA
jgi:hypothetical protein